MNRIQNDAGGGRPDAVQLRLERGKSLLYVSRWQEASEQFEAALASEPEHYYALCMLVLCYRNLRRFDEAFAAARRAIAADPESPDAYYQLSCAQLDKGLPSVALKFGLKALEIDPDWDMAWQTCSVAYLDMKNWEKALDYAHGELERNPQSSAACANLSCAYYGLGNWEYCEGWARRALEIDPAETVALNNLGLALKQQGRHEESLDLFGGALRLDPQSEMVRENLVGTSIEYLDNCHYDQGSKKADGTPMSQEECDAVDSLYGWTIILWAIFVIAVASHVCETFAGAALLVGAVFITFVVVAFIAIVVSAFRERGRAYRQLPEQARLALADARRRGRAEARR